MVQGDHGIIVDFGPSEEIGFFLLNVSASREDGS
jgi:hypothetical protein